MAINAYLPSFMGSIQKRRDTYFQSINETPKTTLIDKVKAYTASEIEECPSNQAKLEKITEMKCILEAIQRGLNDGHKLDDIMTTVTDNEIRKAIGKICFHKNCMADGRKTNYFGNVNYTSSANELRKFLDKTEDGIKNIIIKDLQSVVLDEIGNDSCALEKINTLKLAIKKVQVRVNENINDDKESSFKNDNYYGRIDEVFLNKLLNTHGDDLRIICKHEDIFAPLYVCSKTSYSKSAIKLRNNLDIISRAPFLNKQLASSIVKVFEKKKAEKEEYDNNIKTKIGKEFDRALKRSKFYINGRALDLQLDPEDISEISKIFPITTELHTTDSQKYQSYYNLLERNPQLKRFINTNSLNQHKDRIIKMIMISTCQQFNKSVTPILDKYNLAISSDLDKKTPVEIKINLAKNEIRYLQTFKLRMGNGETIGDVSTDHSFFFNAAKLLSLDDATNFDNIISDSKLNCIDILNLKDTTAYQRKSRDSLADNNTNETKNEQLSFLLDIIKNNNKIDNENILKALINSLTGISNEKLKLSSPIIQAIEFIAANNTNRIIQQDITLSATKLLFAVCHALYENENLMLYNLNQSQLRQIKIDIIREVIDTYVKNDPIFPNLPRDTNGKIKSLKESYLNECIIIEPLNKGGFYRDDSTENLTSNGSIGSYVSGVESDNDGSSDLEDTSDEENNHSDTDSSNKSVENFEDFEYMDAMDSSSTAISTEDNNTKYKRLGNISFNFLIHTWLKLTGLMEEDNKNDNKVNLIKVTYSIKGNKIVYPCVSGRDAINQLLNTLKNDDKIKDRLVLIPYIITNRGILHEDHIVLVTYYNGKVTVYDSKPALLGKTDYQITSVLHKAVCTKWQDSLDRDNCGYYAAYLILQIAENGVIPDIPNIDQLHKQYKIILNRLHFSPTVLETEFSKAVNERFNKCKEEEKNNSELVVTELLKEFPRAVNNLGSRDKQVIHRNFLINGLPLNLELDFSKIFGLRSKNPAQASDGYQSNDFKEYNACYELLEKNSQLEAFIRKNSLTQDKDRIIKMIMLSSCQEFILCACPNFIYGDSNFQGQLQKGRDVKIEINSSKNEIKYQLEFRLVDLWKEFNNDNKPVEIADAYTRHSIYFDADNLGKMNSSTAFKDIVDDMELSYFITNLGLRIEEKVDKPETVQVE